MIIAIDGPAGAGKSTIARRVADSLGYLYIDTGAMFRALTFKALALKIDIQDEKALTAMAAGSTISLAHSSDGSLQVLIDDQDVTKEIREPRITHSVSDLAKVPGVREILRRLQRQLGKSQNSVMDGRDIGTTVFPDAERKFFLDAQFDERVRRRYEELKDKKGVTIDSVAADLRNRDTIDSTRACAPLKKADDALYIDTSRMTIDEVVAAVLKNIPNTKGKSHVR